VTVHVVAERLGDDPAVLLRNYAQRKRQQKANTDFPLGSAPSPLVFWENDWMGPNWVRVRIAFGGADLAPKTRLRDERTAGV
jgi:hypothetical protein